MINIILNRRRFETAEGQTILQVARERDIFIPTFCHDDDLEPYGACRMCIVSVQYKDGTKKIVTACDTLIEEGMVIITDSDEVFDAQADVADFLLSLCPDHPKVLKMAARYGIYESTFITKNIHENCIRCGQCIRACHTRGKSVIDFIGRGENRIVSTIDGKHSAACDTCSACIRYCPTGAVVNGLGLGIGAAYKKKARAQVLWRKFFNKFFLVFFLVLMVLTLIGKAIPFLPNNFFSRIDPYQALMTLISGREPILQYWPSLITLALTLIFGRVWCGWICPLGTILDAYGRNDRRIKTKNLRRIKTVLFFVLVISAFLGSISFIWLDPISMLIQPVLVLFKPGSEFVTQGYLDAFRFLGTLWWLVALPMVLALLLNFIEKRFWCRYICPAGGFLGLLSKFSPKKRHVEQKACAECGECPRSCPVGAIDPENGYRSDPGECIVCLDCAHDCPTCAITFHGEKIFNFKNEFDPGKRELLGTVAVAAAAFGLSTLQKQYLPVQAKNPLRPPGGVRSGETKPEKFLQLCTRCNQCVLACPQDILKPSILESGLEGIGTPIVEFGGSYCDPSCNRCSVVCPSGAIPVFSGIEKMQEKIGLAHVYYPECTRCNRCVDACPYQAFGEVEVEGYRGIYPQVNPDRCNGCGICLAVCPVFKDGAINVYQQNEVPDDSQFIVTPVPEADRSYIRNYYTKTGL